MRTPERPTGKASQTQKLPHQPATAGSSRGFRVVFKNTDFRDDPPVYSDDFFDFFGSSTEWMLGSTPPAATVTPERNLLSSSSLRTASVMWRGMMRDFLLSRAALPASSSTSAAMYSRTAARYTGAPAPMREAYLPSFMWRCTRPTGNCRPAFAEREVAFFLEPPRPPFT